MSNSIRPDDLGQDPETYPDEHRRKMLRAMVLEICRTHDLNAPDMFFVTHELFDAAMKRRAEEDGS